MLHHNKQMSFIHLTYYRKQLSEKYTHLIEKVYAVNLQCTITSLQVCFFKKINIIEVLW